MANNRYSFADMAQVGKWAVEQVFVKLCETGRNVWDVQGDGFFQSLDVDLVASTRDDVELIEVKGDRYPAKNIYVEWISNLNTGALGCMRYMQADTLVYYFVNEGVCLLIPVLEMQAWFATWENNPAREPKQVITKKGGRDLYGSIGYTVPIPELLENVPGTLLVSDWPKWGSK